MLSALGSREADPFRESKYDTARVKIAKAAFLPSRIWDDTAVWTGSTGVRRTLLVNGHLVGGRYRLESGHTLLPITQPADSRHAINLTRISSDEFAWDTDVAYAVGSASVESIAAFARQLFTAAEGRGEHDVRADIHAAIPRASAVLGQLFAIDSIATTMLPDRSTLATFYVSVQPSNLQARYPNFARSMQRYGETTKLRMNLADRAGTSYLEWAIANGRAMLRVRSAGHQLVALTGPARPLPDSLTLNGELTLKVRRFTIGVRDYHAEFTLTRTDREQSWSIVTRREPNWVLPVGSERLLRTPLRRPFRGSGTLFRIGVREDSASGFTLLQRRLHLEVQESTILRLIGRLGSTAVSDFAGRVERERDAWIKEVFDALAADAHALQP